MTDRIVVPGLGELLKISDDASSEVFWRGVGAHEDLGVVEEFTYYLRSPIGSRPSDAQCTFVVEIVRSIDIHVEAARSFLGDRLESEPELFGVSSEVAAAEIKIRGGLLPFSRPEATFYENREWMLRFADCPFPSCDSFGIAVMFDGTFVRNIENLFDSSNL